MTQLPETAPPALASQPLPLQETIEVLEGASSVTVLCHVQPDADTVGSGLALGIVLMRKGIPVQCRSHPRIDCRCRWQDCRARTSWSRRTPSTSPWICS